MSSYRLSYRYAKSLIGLASEQNSLEEVFADVQVFTKAVKSSRELHLMLKSPIINADKKLDILDEIFGDKISKLTNGFIKLLVTKGRESYLPEIGVSFIAQYNLLKNITPAKLKTAVEINDDIKSKIENLLSKDSSVGKVELETEGDESLIGGFVLRYEDKQYDASVARHLHILRQNFEDDSYIRKI